MSEIDAICVLAALTMPGVGFSYEQLKSLPLTTQEVIRKYHPTGTGSQVKTDVKTVPNSSSISKYCINHTLENGSLIPIVGFENEIATIFEVLSRKAKCNLLVIGESGVGKTALFKGFVHRLITKNVPQSLKNCAAFELDLGAIATRASYNGEVEDRARSVFDAIEECENAVLIIESVEKLFDAQNSLFGISNILKQKLNDGRLRILCSSTIDGYTKYIEKDKEFVRQLDKITIDQPNQEQCFLQLHRQS